MTGFRITVDVGGTFSDVAITDAGGRLWIAKAATTRTRASTAIVSAIGVIGEELDLTVAEILASTDVFVYSTTRATNAIIERQTARTALLTTAGFPDIMVRREGGRANAFDHTTPFPEPYVPRSLTFEVDERIDAEGGVVRELSESEVARIVQTVSASQVEAVAVCLLWSIANPVHELRLGDQLRLDLPSVAITLSHQIWPALREYRRASATVIDASLKPVMSEHLSSIGKDLADYGFGGELLAATSFGGVMHLDDLSRRPIYSVKSGPALAPIAGRAAADMMSRALGEPLSDNLVVCDTGGTSFDVSLVRNGEVVLTSETWLGGRFLGDLIPTSSVDARSIGSGGGSIASVDSAGLLHVGPESAGADPGPACYGRGGKRPTVTDAAAVLGYLDPEYFLGGRLELDLDAANSVIGALAHQIGQSTEAAAASILLVADEHMVEAIRDLTVHEGLDPRDCLIVAGGGAAGLSIGTIARAVGARRVLVPSVAGALSAVGGQHSDVVAEFRTARGVTATDERFDRTIVGAALVDLEHQIDEFAAGLHYRGLNDIETEFFADARYAFQVWTIELPVDLPRLVETGNHQIVSDEFDELHRRLFSVAEPGQTVEVLAWRARLTAKLAERRDLRRELLPGVRTALEPREMFFPRHGWVSGQRFDARALQPRDRLSGPALVVDSTTTLVVAPDNSVEVSASGDYILEVAQ